MNDKNEASQRKSGSHRATFWLLFAMSACMWLGTPGSLHAADKSAVSDDQVCNDAWNAWNSGNKADVDDAIAKITSVVQQNTKSWLCFYSRAALYNKKGDVNQAILDLSRADELAPRKEVRPLEFRSEIYVEAQRWDKLLADCDAVLAREHKSAECLVRRGVALHLLGRFQEAVTALDEALEPRNQLPDPWRSEAYFWRGNTLFWLNKYAETIDNYDKAIALRITEPAIYFFRGAAEWKLGQIDKARLDAGTALQLEPRLEMRFSGDHLLEVFDLDKRSVDTLHAVEVAQTAEAKGDWPASFEGWRTAYWYCNIYPRPQDGQVTLAKIVDGLLRSYPKLTVKPALPELARQYQVQAETYFQEKNFAKATEAYGNQIAVAPWFPQGYFNRAFLEGEQQQYKAAVADMQTYLKLAPNAQDAREAQDQIYAWQAKAK